VTQPSSRSPLEELTDREVAVVRGSERPVPLDFRLQRRLLHEAIAKLIAKGRRRSTLVNFTQRERRAGAESLERRLRHERRKARIADVVKGFRFDTPYGKEIQRFISTASVASRGPAAEVTACWSNNSRSTAL